MTITDEEKQAGIWEYQGKDGKWLKFKRCPQCNEAMLASYTSHKCGWGKKEKQEDRKHESIDASTLVCESVLDAMDIVENTLKISPKENLDAVLNIADQIRRTKISERINE
jgi:hypothetical protein